MTKPSDPKRFYSSTGIEISDQPAEIVGEYQMYSASSGEKVLPRHLAAGGIFPKYLLRAMWPKSVMKALATPVADEIPVVEAATPVVEPKPKEAPSPGLIEKVKKSLGKSKKAKKAKKSKKA